MMKGRLTGTAYVPESGLLLTPITLVLGAFVVLRYGWPSASREALPAAQADQA